jgi:putative peptide zinc metalloprotease protein
MLLVFTPVPYVDASATSAFSSKWQRMAVGAGGMIVELALAALAMFVWVNAQPGLVRVLAFNTLLIGGVTTVLFNANPLLRFDGYYILADWLEMPNLRQRSNRYVGYLVERWVLRVQDAEEPRATPRERAWLVGYAVASFVYRALITFAIALWVLGLSLPLGLALLAVSAVGWLVMPAYKAIRFLLSSPRLARIRGRAAGGAAGALLGATLFLVAVPFPLHTLTEGVVWIPDEAQVRAKVDGFVEEIVAVPGSRVERGDVLLRCADRALEAELEVARATVRELEGRHDKALHENLVDAQVVAEELGYARENLARVLERSSDLVVEAGTAGTFVLPRARDLPGRFAAQGTILGQVVDLEAIRVRAVIGQDDIDLVRERQRGVQVRPAEALGRVHHAEVRRLVPGASGRLPHEALGAEGGGPLAIDPRDRSGHTTLEKFFEVELELPSDAGIVNAGGRVHVRFDHGWEPLAQQLYRRLRQVFLARLNV